MLFNISLIEWIGYLGSALVAVSLTMSSIKKLRWYNLTGAAIFSFYGFAIGALPVALLNLFIVIADAYYLYLIYAQKDSFKSIVVNTDKALNSIDWNNAGNMLAVSSSNSNVYIYNFPDLSLYTVFQGHKGQVYQAQFFSSDSLISTGADARVNVWSLPQKQLMKIFTGF